MAVQNGLLEFSSLLRGKTIALFCDNVTTVAYLRRLGGTRSQVLFLIAKEIFLWVESMKITLLPRSRRERSRSVDRYRSRRQRTRSPARWGERRDRLRSPALPGSPACLRAEAPGRLARRETQEGVVAVASQPPVVSEAAAGVNPVAGGASITALPSVVQDLARFFLGLSSSSSLGATGGIVGVTVSTAASGGIAYPATAAGGAATICATAVTPAGAGVSPAAPTAVPGVSGEQQHQMESRSRGRRSRSSSDGTDRRTKKRSRRRSPSPERSSRCRGRRYRSSSDSS